jgi:hypothetical protein
VEDLEDLREVRILDGRDLASEWPQWRFATSPRLSSLVFIIKPLRYGSLFVIAAGVVLVSPETMYKLVTTMHGTWPWVSMGLSDPTGDLEKYWNICDLQGWGNRMGMGNPQEMSPLESWNVILDWII